MDVYSIRSTKFSLPGIRLIASQNMAVLSAVIIHTAINMAVGSNQPASAKRFGSCGTPGPVMLLISRHTPAPNPIVLDPIQSSWCRRFTKPPPAPAMGASFAVPRDGLRSLRPAAAAAAVTSTASPTRVYSLRVASSVVRVVAWLHGVCLSFVQRN